MRDRQQVLDLFRRIAFCGLVSLFGIWASGTAFAVDEPVDFARDVRPILSDNCFKCHGPDEDARQADLRLDTEEGLSTSVDLEHPLQSELLTRVVAGENDDELMPPRASNKSLSADQKLTLRKWVEQGATWQQHWSFVAPVEPAVPPVSGTWPRTEIDRFILQSLSDEGLSPGVDADPYTLVRRLYLDLIGLLPTSAEADAWVAKIWPNDESSLRNRGVDERAYQELVSYLLDSPHYGEKWARTWLDLARYADTNGYEKDRERSIWPYRDWVIHALNQDMPYDQFTVEQLAGDLLPNASLEQKIATGFHRNTMLNEEGGIDPLEFRFHAMTDRVATTGTTWLGLTLGCCQCHTHKYDPISHTEYFQLMAYLNNADEPQLELPDADFEKIWQDNRAQAAKLISELPDKWPLPKSDRTTADGVNAELDATSEPSANLDELAKETQAAEAALRRRLLERAFDVWLARERENHAPWTVATPTQATSNLPTLTIEEDGSIFASGDTAKRDDYRIQFGPAAQDVTALQLEALPDERLPARGPGTTYYEGTLGDFYLTEITLAAEGQSIALESATESYAKNRYGKNPVSAQLAIDGDVQTGWSVHGRQGERHVAVFLLSKPIPAGTPFSVQMAFGRHFASSLGRFRFRTSSSRGPLEARDYSDSLASLLGKHDDELSGAEREQLMQRFLLTTSELQAETDAIRDLLKRPSVSTTLIFSERPPAHPRTTHRHHRGEYLQAAEEVTANPPEVLPAMPATFPNNRLGFAKWLVMKENPLTARVAVNRAWASFFGTGLVKTLDDFGLQGEPPSHPELLDWLALHYSGELGWSTKELHRSIVSSSTYRQTSIVNTKARQQDPGNRLLSYFPRVRLDAEVLRDSLLLASGKLSKQMGGPPVYPPQPAGVTQVAYGSPDWPESQGEDRYRRSVYTFVKRTAPFAMFSTFDAPSGEACIARRTRSNSPLQALTLLNDVMLTELARGAAESCWQDEGEHAEKLKALFRSVLVRPPATDELRLLNYFFESRVDEYAANPLAAIRLLGFNEIKPRSKEDEQQYALQAAWTATARALFSLDETQTRE